MEKIKSVLEKYVNANARMQSPLIGDVQRVVNYDKNGNEIITYAPVDNSAIVKANGSANNWTLNSLLAAGVNPNFPIHTGVGTRLDGYADVANAAAEINALLDEADKAKAE